MIPLDNFYLDSIYTKNELFIKFSIATWICTVI